jgi:acyl-CoA reductase-like NAD-dependent aldehyde dehydrogenase
LLLDGRDSEVPNDTGFYLGPSVFADVGPEAIVAREEIFGPVITIERFSDEREAVKRANSTGYGLAATIWTINLPRAHRVANAMRAGTVHVNATVSLPEGSGLAHAAEPVGNSGFGVEGGMAGLDSYGVLKATAFYHG